MSLSDRLDWARLRQQLVPMLQARGEADIRETRVPIHKGDTGLRVIVIHSASESTQEFTEAELKRQGLLR